MNNEDKITILIKQAISNGYKFPFTDYILQRSEMMYGHAWWPAILFDRYFVEHLFGDESIYDEDGGLKNEYVNASPEPDLKVWQYHLQQAVLSENPIEYYWENRPLK